MTGPEDAAARVLLLRQLAADLHDERRSRRDGAPATPLQFPAVDADAARRAVLNVLEDAVAAHDAETRAQVERLRVEQALRDHEQYFRKAVEDAPIPMLMQDEHGTVLQVSRTWTELTGTTPDDLARFDEWLARASASGAHNLKTAISSAFAAAVPPRPVEMAVATTVAGLRHWSVSTSVPGRLSDGRRYLVAMVLDVTERRRAEAQLQESREQLHLANEQLEARVAERTDELAESNRQLNVELLERVASTARIESLLQRLVHAQEEERRRVARDLHDQVGQQVTALRMALELLSESAALSAADLEQAARARRIAAQLDRSIDYLTGMLHPSMLDDLPIAVALVAMGREWADEFGVDLQFVASGAETLRFAPDVQTHIYRVAQEALHNVCKHAVARSVSMTLEQGAASAVLSIRDDGTGFEPAAHGAQQGPHGLGLVSMRERASLIGGTLEVAASIGGGCCVTLDVPLPPALGSAP